jgi:lipoprotein-anchoring transpeptidase ErfK/SrfK
MQRARSAIQLSCLSRFAGGLKGTAILMMLASLSWALPAHSVTTNAIESSTARANGLGNDTVSKSAKSTTANLANLAAMDGVSHATNTTWVNQIASSSDAVNDGSDDSASDETVNSSNDAQPDGSAKNSDSTAKPPDNQEWVAAWVSDLRHSSQRWILIDLSEQRLSAMEGDTPIMSVPVSTGVAEHPTPTGVYQIEVKYRTSQMQGEDYNIPNVPFVMYYDGNYAIHGVYWHHNFGMPYSHGCTNVPMRQAAWLYNWAPEGTRVVVQQ